MMISIIFIVQSLKMELPILQFYHIDLKMNQKIIFNVAIMCVLKSG